MDTISKAQLCVIHAASDDATRHNLNCVQLRADGTVIATNGHILAKVEGKQNHNHEILLTTKSAKQLQKALPKGQPAAVSYTNAKPNMHVKVEGGSISPQELDVAPSEFPETDQITKQLPLENGSKHVRIGIDIHYLERLCKIVRGWSETTTKTNQMVEFRIPLDTKELKEHGYSHVADAVHVLGTHAKNGAPDLHCVIMPMGVDSYSVTKDKEAQHAKLEKRKAQSLQSGESRKG